MYAHTHIPPRALNITYTQGCPSLRFAPFAGYTKNNNKRCHHVHVLKTKRSTENADRRPFAFGCSSSSSSLGSWRTPPAPAPAPRTPLQRLPWKPWSLVPCEPATEAPHKAKLTNCERSVAETATSDRKGVQWRDMEGGQGGAGTQKGLLSAQTFNVARWQPAMFTSTVPSG